MPQIVEQRILEASTSLFTTEGNSITVRHHSGALQGDSVAGEIFSCAYEPRVQAWIDRTTDPRKHVACPFSGIQVDASITAFVDDLLRVCILDNCPASHVALAVAQNDKALDEELEAIGIAQHPGKIEVPLGARVVEPLVASLLAATFDTAS